MKTLLILLCIVSSIHILKAQDRIEEVKINTEMVERFNKCESDTSCVSWKDLILGFDYQTLFDFFQAYKTVDLSNETLIQVKYSLQAKLNQVNNVNISEQEFAWYNQIKKEINNKLILSEVTALK